MGRYRRNVFHFTADYPVLKVLEDNWESILAEYLAVANQVITWPERHLHNDKWKAYGLLFKGEYLDNDCPRTTEIVRNIPGAYIAGFSVLKAGCIISPHTGYTDNVLRTHLGLVCPEGCWIKVDNESYTWKAGKAVLFNDMLLHEAANESDEDRVVLIVDIQKGEAC